MQDDETSRLLGASRGLRAHLQALAAADPAALAAMAPRTAQDEQAEVAACVGQAVVDGLREGSGQPVGPRMARHHAVAVGAAALETLREDREDREEAVGHAVLEVLQDEQEQAGAQDPGLAVAGAHEDGHGAGPLGHGTEAGDEQTGAWAQAPGGEAGRRGQGPVPLPRMRAPRSRAVAIGAATLGALREQAEAHAVAATGDAVVQLLQEQRDATLQAQGQGQGQAQGQGQGQTGMPAALPPGAERQVGQGAAHGTHTAAAAAPLPLGALPRGQAYAIGANSLQLLRERRAREAAEAAAAASGAAAVAAAAQAAARPAGMTDDTPSARLLSAIDSSGVPVPRRAYRPQSTGAAHQPLRLPSSSGLAASGRPLNEQHQHQHQHLGRRVGAHIEPRVAATVGHAVVDELRQGNPELSAEEKQEQFLGGWASMHIAKEQAVAIGVTTLTVLHEGTEARQAWSQAGAGGGGSGGGGAVAAMSQQQWQAWQRQQLQPNGRRQQLQQAVAAAEERQQQFAHREQLLAAVGSTTLDAFERQRDPAGPEGAGPARLASTEPAAGTAIAATVGAAVLEDAAHRRGQPLPLISLWQQERRVRQQEMDQLQLRPMQPPPSPQMTRHQNDAYNQYGNLPRLGEGVLLGDEAAGGWGHDALMRDSVVARDRSFAGAYLEGAVVDSDAVDEHSRTLRQRLEQVVWEQEVRKERRERDQEQAHGAGPGQGARGGAGPGAGAAARLQQAEQERRWEGWEQEQRRRGVFERKVAFPWPATKEVRPGLYIAGEEVRGQEAPLQRPTAGTGSEPDFGVPGAAAGAPLLGGAQGTAGSGMTWAAREPLGPDSAVVRAAAGAGAAEAEAGASAGAGLGAAATSGSGAAGAGAAATTAAAPGKTTGAAGTASVNSGATELESAGATARASVPGVLGVAAAAAGQAANEVSTSVGNLQGHDFGSFGRGQATSGDLAGAQQHQHQPQGQEQQQEQQVPAPAGPALGPGTLGAGAVVGGAAAAGSDAAPAGAAVGAVPPMDVASRRLL